MTPSSPPPRRRPRATTLRVSGLRIDIRGIVQGVGFRPWVYRLATLAGITGRVRNDGRGVSIDAFGSRAALGSFVASLRGEAPPPAARIEGLETSDIPPESVDGFTIVKSLGGSERHVSIPPDLATCPDCLREVADPKNRRHGYAFTNCTNCGPRFTIALDVPYDRERTTMAPFEMCPACRAEYEQVSDRRFHAQPNACTECGPTLVAVLPGDAVLREDPIRAAAARILAGGIVAVKGLGGFHLACDATSDAAVRRLRQRKHRDEKPFAVMAPDVASAEALAVLGHEELRLLQSVERPIVITWRQGDARLPASIAPGSGLLGVFLPYTPLHHLLLAACGRPLVMTSGNLSDEPIAYRNREAMERLADVADLFLLHDREIVTRCDDSVATVIAGEPVLLRRSRGFVPRAVPLATAAPVPVLGTGALLKNTFCLVSGRDAWLGPHIGDLENESTLASYEESIGRMERFLHVTPELVAHDLHPDYLSTRYAQARPGVRAIAVQHHHAHVASLIAEHGVEGPIIGVAFDGTGLGTDGTSWGGEVLVATAREFTRVATFKPVPLAGGDAAIRQPWRIALALVDDAFGGDPPIDALRLFAGIPANEIEVVRQMIRHGLNAPLARGAGRYFDAFGALALGRGTISFEGQLALALNVIADPSERGRYEYAVTTVHGLAELDLGPAVREAVFEIIGRAAPEAVSAKFHNTLASAAAELVRTAARAHGRLPVGLTGGCFQNARLAESLSSELRQSFRMYLHGRVPPGDGGIALGQAMVAAASDG
jgi:hydrogenase maturation protein HypF